METYDFQWSDLGNMEQGRPHLGKEAPVAIYRLMQFTLKDILSKEFGLAQTNAMLCRAGELAGREFCRNVLNTDLSFNEFFADFGSKLIDLKIGILRVESADMHTMHFTVSVAEDLDCSGLPILGETVCSYDEGFIAGVFNEFTGKKFTVREIDCWAIGDRTCRFDIRPAVE